VLPDKNLQKGSKAKILKNKKDQNVPDFLAFFNILEHKGPKCPYFSFYSAFFKLPCFASHCSPVQCCQIFWTQKAPNWLFKKYFNLILTQFHFSPNFECDDLFFLLANLFRN